MKRNRSRKGFTLIELLIVMSLLALLLSAVYRVVVSANNSRASQDRIVELQQNVRSAADFIVRELRASSAISCMGNTTTTCATAGYKITFTSVIDANTRIFSWSSTNKILQFSTSAGAANLQVLADNITAFTLTPYDSTNTVTNNVANVKRIDVTVTGQTAQSDPVTGAYRTYSLTLSAQKRN